MIKVIKIIENLILGFVKFYILALSMLSANIDDYLIPLTFFEKMLIVGRGFIIVVLLDFVINFIVYKFVNKKDKFVKYKSLLYVSLIITLLEFIFLLIAGF